MQRRSKIVLAVFSSLVLAGYLATTFALAQAQPDAQSAPEARAAAAASGAEAPLTVQYESHLTIRDDLSATELTTKRLRVNAPVAIQAVGQQRLPYIEGMHVLEVVEAFTEKPDGRRIAVAPSNIITQDAAPPQQATYFRDMKQRTVIFPDVSVGDTLVLTSKTEQVQSVFPGQFIYAEMFPRNLSFTSADVTVEAPAALDLQVKVTGGSGNDLVEAAGNVQRHRITIITKPYHAEERGAVSPLDRDPVLLISTFKSYEDLGRTFGSAAFPRAAVTPEIAALADEITRNIDDRRAQAAAIDAWMKKNIRYVAVYLSLGRVVPNIAVDVLRNRFGDCKDKVTLMLALLAAKGITGEAALMNLGNAYSLPEPPTLAALNHVILYLPEFGLYDDPTVTWAAFGVLAPEGYDKPVVRVSETAATLGRTPAMRPEDHTAHAVTSIRVATDGTITGQTRETSTGVFGIVLRTAGGLVQSVGHETGAQRLLQTYNTPGSGRFDLSNIAEAVDPVTISSSFTLNDRFRAPAPGGRAVIPFGLPLTVRVGNFLLGTRLSGRLSAFACYAGTQTEDIDASFDPGLPMPTPLAPAKIDNPFLSYRSSFQIDGRTLKIHRELTSHVPGQVCAPEVEAQIGENLNAVRVEVNSTYAFGPTQPQTLELKRAVAAGQKLRLDFLYSLNVDCSSMGFATVRIVEQPQHGNATIEHGTGYTTFPESNPRSACNKRTSDGTLISYEPGSDYTGADTVAIEATYPNGALTKRRYSIQVSPVISAEMTPPGPRPPQPTSLTTPRTLEFTRVAAADQKLLVTFVYDLNPDCSSIGYATVRITEQPQHGTVTMENGTGFSTFAQNNIRYECNKRRSDGVVVSYAPEAGFTGADSLTVDVILPDGGFNKRHYAIDVR